MDFKVYFIFKYVYVFVSVCAYVHIRAAQHQARQHASIDGQGAQDHPS